MPQPCCRSEQLRVNLPGGNSNREIELGLLISLFFRTYLSLFGCVCVSVYGLGISNRPVWNAYKKALSILVVRCCEKRTSWTKGILLCTLSKCMLQNLR